MNYQCSICGENHDELLGLAFEKPFDANDIPEEEHDQRVQLGSDLCVVDNEHFFIRGVIDIPVHGQDEPFGIGVWVSLKKENFYIYENHFDSDDIGPFFGWLSIDFMFGGESTLLMKTSVHFLGNGECPQIVLDPTEHPLSVAQREGLSLDEVWTLLHEYL